jgi:hypothetical protein
MTALVLIVPAELERPCWLAAVPDRRGLRGWWERRRRLAELVGPAIITYHLDGDAHVRIADTWHGPPRPLNQRATRYLREHSEAAGFHHRQGREWPPSFRAYGDVLVAGSDPGRPWRDLDVPARLLDRFEVAR